MNGPVHAVPAPHPDSPPPAPHLDRWVGFTWDENGITDHYMCPVAAGETVNPVKLR